MGMRVEDAHDLAVLRSSCLAGLVTLGEFTRSAAALVAGGAASWSAAATWSGLGTARRWTFGVLRAARHRLSGLTPPRIGVVAVTGAATLDLAGARLLGDELQVRAIAVLAAVEVLVPAGLEVELRGARAAAPLPPPVPGAPRVRVRGVPVLGRVRVARSP
jgi:hypothetical protein